MSLEIRRLDLQIKTLEELIDRARIATLESQELQSHWAQYLCVLCSGLIENAMKVFYIEYADRRTGAEFVRFVDRALSRSIQNPNAEDLIDLAKRFKDQWGEDLNSFLNENGRREAINAIIAQRKLIAHGRGRESNISMESLRDKRGDGYVPKVIEVIEFIRTMLLDSHAATSKGVRQ